MMEGSMCEQRSGSQSLFLISKMIEDVIEKVETAVVVSGRRVE